MLHGLIRFLTSKKGDLAKKQLKLSSEKTEICQEKDINLMVILWKKLQKNKITRFDNFYDACIYASIVARDINYLSDSFVMTKNPSLKIYSSEMKFYSSVIKNIF